VTSSSTVHKMDSGYALVDQVLDELDLAQYQIILKGEKMSCSLCLNNEMQLIVFSLSLLVKP